MNTERLHKLADLLDAHAALEEGSNVELGFNMITWGARCSVDKGGHPCGTAACIAGWAAAYFGYAGRAEKFDIKRALNLAEHFNGDVISGMAPVLGLTLRQARALFLPNTPGHQRLSERLSLMESLSITPSEAAVTLRKLAETGEVDWSHVKERYQAELEAA